MHKMIKKKSIFVETGKNEPQTTENTFDRSKHPFWIDMVSSYFKNKSEQHLGPVFSDFYGFYNRFVCLLYAVYCT